MNDRIRTLLHDVRFVEVARALEYLEGKRPMDLVDLQRALLDGAGRVLTAINEKEREK